MFVTITIMVTTNLNSQPVKYFLYIRKSTDEEDRQVLSLEAQLHEVREFATKEHLEIVETFIEKKTAKAPGREQFNKMLDTIQEGLPYPVGILSWHPDRLSRNSVDGGRIVYLLDTGKLADLKFPTYRFDNTPSGKYVLQLLLAYGKYYVDNLAENVRRGVREKLRRGEWPGSNKPLGYVYDQRLRNIVPHPKEAKVVQKIFAEFATGKHGLESIAKRLADFGITSKSGKPRSKFCVKLMLTNEIYIGVMRWQKEVFEGKFRPLISKSTFDRVQEVLKHRAKPRKSKKRHEFPFCGLFSCRCGSMFTAQFARGNGGLYRYYRCTRKHGVCNERYIQEYELKDQIAAAAKTIAVPPNWIPQMNEWIDGKLAKESRACDTMVVEIQKKLSLVQEKLDKLLEGYLDAIVDAETYQSKNRLLVTEKTALKSEKESLQRKRLSSWIEPTRTFVKTLEIAGKLDSESDLSEIATLVQKIGTNRRIEDKNVCFEFQKPFDFTASFLTSHLTALSATGSENHKRFEWCARQDLNLQPPDPKSEALSN